MTASSTELKLFKTAAQVASSINRSGRKTQIKASMAIFFQTLTVSCNLALMYLLGKSIENVVEGSSNNQVHIGNREAEYLIYSGMVLVGSIVSNGSSRLLTSSVKSEYAVEVNSRLIKKYSELDLDYTLTRPLGVFVRMIQHVYATQEAVPLLIDEMYPSVVELLLANTALLVIDWQLGLVLSGALAVSGMIVFLGTKSVKDLYEAQENDGFAVYGKVIGRIQDHQNIRLFGRVENEIQSGVSDLKQYGTGFSKLSQLPEYNGLVQGLWGVCVFAAMLSLIAARKDHTKLSVNYFPMILIYLVQISRLFDKASRATSNLIIAEAGMSAINDFMLTPMNNPDALVEPRSFKISDTTSSINFRNVVFRYDAEIILNNVTFSIQPGSKAAIVGLSGTGKSTIAKLLLRSYAPETGTVEIGGYDINGIRTESLCKVVGLVPQHPRFPNGSLANILREAKDDATDAELFTILQKVSLTEFATTEQLLRVPGEGGFKLSGGQMQRLAIARALLKEPYILIFDEATSALDMDTAMDVTAAMDRETMGITSIIITHNILSIRNADKIIVLDQGRVVQEGTFNQLLSEQSGRFYRLLWNYFRLNGMDIESISPSEVRNVPRSIGQQFHRVQREFVDTVSPADHFQVTDRSSLNATNVTPLLNQIPSNNV